MNDEENKQIEVEEDDCDHKCEEYLNGWKRALADYDNLKKELGREKVESAKYAKTQFAKNLLPVIDSFDLAMKFVPDDSEKDSAFLKGIQNIRTQFEEALKKSGIESYAEIGEAFDPHLHEAVAQKSEEGVEEDTIVEVLERGWMCEETVLRPAKVIIQN